MFMCIIVETGTSWQVIISYKHVNQSHIIYHQSNAEPVDYQARTLTVDYCLLKEIMVSWGKKTEGTSSNHSSMHLQKADDYKWAKSV